MANVEHSTLAPSALHEDKRIKEPVRAASTSSITLATPGSTMDGVTLVSGNRILLKDQSSPSENGIYVWTGASSPLTRALDADAASEFFYGFQVYVREGSVNATRFFVFTQSGTVTLGSTALTFAQGGGVTSIALTMPSDFSVAGSPITGSGTLAVTATTQTANTVKAGPTSGSAAAPTYRALVPADVALTTTGDIPYASSSTVLGRIAPSTSGYVLTSNGAGIAPSFQAATGGSGSGTGGTGGSIVPIQTQTPSSGTSITFTVPAGFKNLRITGTVRSGVSATSDNISLQFNGDTGANYNRQASGATSSTIQTSQLTGQTSLLVAGVSGNTSLASTAGGFSIEIPDHAGTTYFKVARGVSLDVEGAAASGVAQAWRSGFWANSAAIISITVLLGTGPFTTGSTLTLWGEADTAPVLLTSNSNLIQETILKDTAASISFPNIPQGYRELRLVWHARGDTSATDTTIRFQANGDTGSNYDAAEVQSSITSVGGGGALAATAALIGFLNANTAPSNDFSSGEMSFVDYTASTIRRSGFYRSTLNRSDSTNSSNYAMHGRWTWRNTSSPITSFTLTPTAGNFIAGSVFRLYGEPAAAAGPSVGTGTKLRISSNQSITTATATLIAWDTEDNDADNQHYTSASNLTGTVSKTAGSTTITGSSTAFTTELSVGQVISIPGTAAEKVVVTAIASNTSLTVATALANSASGQTATRVNSAVVFRQPGFYEIEASIYSAALASGAVTLGIRLNDATTPIKQIDPVAVNASAGYQATLMRQFQQWDFIEVVWTQNSGGSVNVLADERTHLSVSSRPTVIVAVPYVQLQDQKAANTAGGTFTSGAWQTRTLNTVVADTASLTSLSSNQFSLPPGTYRVRITSPAYAVGRHKARLQNITDSATTLLGMSAYAATGAVSIQNVSIIDGRMTLTATKTFEVQHRCETTESSNGFGVESNFSVTEIYTDVEIWKEG